MEIKDILLFHIKTNKKDEAREKLITHNLRLIAHIVKKYDNCGVLKDDLISVGTIGLIKAIDTFDIEKSNKILGRAISFDAIKDSVEDGLYKLDATVQARKYEDNIRVKNAPNCIIMAISPELGTWEVVGYVERGKFKKLFKGDIDELSTHWVIQVLEAQRDYTISAYAKHDDLYINFVSNASYEEYESESYDDEDYETKSDYDEDYE